MDSICNSIFSLSQGNIDYLPLASPQSYINGSVLNDSRGISNVLVTTDTGISITTDISGSYSLVVPSGTYNLSAVGEPEYYSNNSIKVNATAGMTVLQDIEISKKPTGMITGVVKDT